MVVPATESRLDAAVGANIGTAREFRKSEVDEYASDTLCATRKSADELVNAKRFDYSPTPFHLSTTP